MRQILGPTPVGLMALFCAPAMQALADDPDTFCEGVDYSSCEHISGGDARTLQCCVAYGDVGKEVIELGAGTYVLDPAGPRKGSLRLPPGTTLRSTLTNPDAADVCARAPSATIDIRQLPATPDSFANRAIQVGVGGSMEDIRMRGGFDILGAERTAVPCIDLSRDSQLKGITTEDCFQGVLLRAIHPVPFVIDASIRESCFQGGYEPVVGALGWPYPVAGQHVRLGVYDTVIKNSYSALLSWIGGDGDDNQVDVYVENSTIANSYHDVARVTGGQDVNCCTPRNTGGGNHGRATLVLGPGNHIDGYFYNGISVEGGTRGGSNQAGYFEADPTSHNVATLVLSCDTEFTPSGGRDVFLRGNANESWPTWNVPVGTDNLAQVTGHWSDDVGIEAVDCFDDPAECGSTAWIDPDGAGCDAEVPAVPLDP